MENNNEIKKERKPNKWLNYVKEVREKHPELPYKEILKLGKESYIKIEPLNDEMKDKKPKKKNKDKPESE